MIIQLSKIARHNLRYIIRRKYSKFQSFAKLNGVSNVVLSRQLKTGAIEYTFLVKYLISLEFIPASYQTFKTFDENFFITTLPVKYRDDVRYLF